MDKVVIKLTVYFADPFWVGVIDSKNYLRGRTQGL